MSEMQKKLITYVSCASVSFFFLASSPTRAQDTGGDAGLAQIRQQLEEQTRKLDAERKKLAEQERQLSETRRNLDNSQRELNQLKAKAGMVPPPPAPTATVARQEPDKPVGQAPEETHRALEIAQIFEQPGVLTPHGKFTIEPSLQYAYSTSNRVSLVGYTVIPAILIGLIDIREVQRTTYTATLTGRYGVTNRFEIETKIPYVYRDDTTVSRAFNRGSDRDVVFESDGKGLGDIELTGRYQFNDGGADNPYYIGTLRLKSRTGKDPFESKLSSSVQGLVQGIETELPTGSGFFGVQPGLTVLYPSDPGVFFGSISYLHNFEREDVDQEFTDGPDVRFDSVKPGGIFGFNFGMGLALNERSSFSIGYDHSSVGKTRIEQDGESVANSVSVQLATLLLGFSYQLDPKRSLNVSLGAGLTVDTPDVTLTVRMPTNL
jgi:hypothetical protein